MTATDPVHGAHLPYGERDGQDGVQNQPERTPTLNTLADLAQAMLADSDAIPTTRLHEAAHGASRHYIRPFRNILSPTRNQRDLEQAAYDLLLKFHSETPCGDFHDQDLHWAECNQIVDAYGYETWDEWRYIHNWTYLLDKSILDE